MKKTAGLIAILVTALNAAGCGTIENGPSQITLNAAEEKALADAGLTASDVSSLNAKAGQTDGVSVYNIEFCTDTTKYEYEIQADTGEIYSKSRESTTGRETVPAENQQTADNRNEGQTNDGQTNQPQAGQEPGTPENPEQNGQRPSTPETPAQSGQGSDSQDNPAQSGQTANTPPTQGGGQSAVPRPAQTGDEQVTLDTAKTAALADAGLTVSDVTYTKESLDYEDGVAVYEIEFYTPSHEYEYEIHAASGTIHSRCVEPHYTGTGHHGTHHREDHRGSCGDTHCNSYWNDYCHREGAAGTDIGADEAKNIALNHAGLSADNVVFSKTELDWEDGLAVYEIEFIVGITEYEYKINAYDGTILEFEID